MTYHFEMFAKCILQFGSEEQAQKWMPLVNSVKIIGCYAQTELGHGSNVAGLETTATLDMNTDEFVIHTPSITATKFWQGNMGVQATHAIVFARLLVAGNDYGVQSFIVPLRDLDTHKPLPGIEIGDIGNKIGYQSIDNGYVSFNKVRVPRDYLMQRFLSVSPAGKIKPQGNPKMIYQVMVQTRISILTGATFLYMRAAKYAIRYAACRRQFANVQGSEQERQLLDYQMHMDTLSRNLCNSITF